jgi:hypothetical protein
MRIEPHQMGTDKTSIEDWKPYTNSQTTIWVLSDQQHRRKGEDRRSGCYAREEHGRESTSFLS